MTRMILVVALLAFAGAAWADAFSDYEAARDARNSGNYDLAIH